MQGALLDAQTVKVDVGALTIRSEQDKIDFQSRQNSIGISASLDRGQANTADSSGTVGFNFGMSSEDGRFASVAEQSGINARDGGFDITVRGATELEAAIISQAAKAPELRGSAAYNQSYKRDTKIGGLGGARCSLSRTDLRLAFPVVRELTGKIVHFGLKTGDFERYWLDALYIITYLP